MSRALIVRLLVVVASLATFLILVHSLVPTSAGWVGEDYSYFLPYLVAGSNWVHLHGWISPPHFTPDYCGGIPWLGNPQSVFYSLPQLLATYSSPLTAIRWTLIVSAVGGASATVLLLHRRFGISIDAALLGGVFFLLNGFLTLRLSVGHLPYHVIALVLLIAFAAMPATKGERATARIAVIAICLAAMVFSGATNLVVPMVLAVAAILLLAQLRTGWRTQPWLRLLVGSLWAIPLSAIKLVPAFLLVRQFPRADPPALFNSFPAFLATVTQSLFLPNALPAMRRLGSNPAPLAQHEFEFSVTLVPALLLGAALVTWLRRPHAPKHRSVMLGLLLVLGLVIAMSFGSAEWSHLLQRIPLVNNNTLMTRWWLVFMLSAMVAAAMAFDWLVMADTRRIWLLVGCAAVAIGQVAMRDLSRYTTARVFIVYDPAPASEASARVAHGIPLPAITVIARPAIRSRPDATFWALNDGAFRGESPLPCYEPLFDHDLRLFPAKQLVTGPIMQPIGSASINLVDPRCYYSGSGGGCKPGDLFLASDSAAAIGFANHDDLPWHEPAWQSWSAIATVLTLGVTTGVVLFGTVRRIQGVRSDDA